MLGVSLSLVFGKSKVALYTLSFANKRMPFQSLTQKQKLMKNDLIFRCQITTLFSFVIGTLLFTFYLYFRDWNSLAYIGLLFILLALIVNGFFVVTLLFSIAFYPNKWQYYLKTIGLMLLNIPIAFGYFYILVEF